MTRRKSSVVGSSRGEQVTDEEIYRLADEAEVGYEAD